MLPGAALLLGNEGERSVGQLSAGEFTFYKSLYGCNGDACPGFTKLTTPPGVTLLAGFDLGSKLDNTVRRDPKKLGRPRRVACQAGVEALPPSRHPGLRARFHVGASDKE